MKWLSNGGNVIETEASSILWMSDDARFCQTDSSDLAYQHCIVLCSYLVGCCPISDLFGKGKPILGEA